MPGLMALRERYGAEQPLAGARIMGSLHMTVQTAVLIETLVPTSAPTCAGCRATSSRPRTTPPRPSPSGPRARPSSPKGITRLRLEGRDPRGVLVVHREALVWPDGKRPDLIVDDGGDATLLVHKALEFEKAGACPPSTPKEEPEEWGVILDLLRRELAAHPGSGRARPRIRGVSEETTTGVHRLYQMEKAGTLLFPAINVNDSVTKSKFDNIYGCRHSLIDGLNRATDVMLGGKVAVVCGFGEVGKGCAQSLRGQGCRVIVTEIDPICALQAVMEGYEVDTLDDVLEKADVFVTATGNAT
jgi:adenosylhomocysteinase